MCTSRGCSYACTYKFLCHLGGASKGILGVSGIPPADLRVEKVDRHVDAFVGWIHRGFVPAPTGCCPQACPMTDAIQTEDTTGHCWSQRPGGRSPPLAVASQE